MKFMSSLVNMVNVAILSMAIALGSSSSVIAQETPEGRPLRNPPMQLLRQLNLTEAQKQQIKTIQERDRESRKSAIEQLRSGETELKNMLDGTSSNETIRAKFNQIQNLRQQNMKMHFEQMLAIREVLTVQQRSQLSQILKSGQGKFRERLQKRQPMPES